MDKLLQDAIADAKAVRETALANAKLALEEAFTPHLKSMLSKKLQAEMENEDEESHDEGYHGEEEEEKDESVSEEADSSGIGASDNKEPGDAGDTSGIGQGPESEGSDEDGGDEDENLEDAPNQPMGEGMKDEEMEDEEMEDEAHHEGMHDEEEDKKDEGMHDEEMEDEDDDIAEVLRQLEAEMADEEDEPKEGYHDDEMEDEEMKKEEMEDEEMEEEIDLDEIIKALTEEEEVNEEEEEEKKEEAMVPAAELEEYKQTVQYLKDKLSEVNLLNAKLLYTNKLFRSRNVSEEQKMKVIEQFDRAANVREVKLVYTTFAESIARKPVNESAKRVSKASKPVASTESKKPIIGENTDFKSRMKKLANII